METQTAALPTAFDQPEDTPPTLRLALPKGRIQQGVQDLMDAAGCRISKGGRSYRPTASWPGISLKLLKPQNIPRLIALGRQDVGFTGRDWVTESGGGLQEVLDLGLDPVRIVAAAPAQTLDMLRDPDRARQKTWVVASEYEVLSRQFLESRGLDYRLVRTWGATEVFPPEDADFIIDNCATGATLAAAGLEVFAEIMQSNTVMVASRQALEDPSKAATIADLKLLLQAVMEGRRRLMVEMNVPGERLDAIVGRLPCMRAPTVSPLYRSGDYAVKTAVLENEVARLIPELRALGATDILVYRARKILP